MKKMNKTNAVALHLLENGSITPLEAQKICNTMRLSGIIYNLKKRGMDIRTEDVPFVDCYGDKSHYAKYILEK